MWLQKASCNASAASASDTRGVTRDTNPGVACGGSHLTGGCSTPREQPQCCGCGGNHTANYCGCVKWKEANAALVNQAPERGRKIVATGQPAAPKAQRAGPSTEQMDLSEELIQVALGGRVVKATIPPSTSPHPKPSPLPVSEMPEQPIETTTREAARPQKPDPKFTAAPKRASGMSKKKAAATVKTAAATPKKPNLVVPTQRYTSPLEEISDFLEHLPLHACVELTRRLLTSISSLPTGTARPCAVLRTAIFL